ncbi:MAG: lysophospholipid acyltransferase family protein [Algibacter sp.]
MKTIGLHSVRAYIKLGLFFYYKKITVVNIGAIPKDKPVLFLSNHQNALLDALLIATTCNRTPYFLTRAGVFKMTFIGKLLNGLRMLPVYRKRDGWGTIKNNNAIFETCAALLNTGKSVGVFPEGNHNLKRTVRPLSRGFTRIVFETLDHFPNTDLQIIPVGMNYRNPKFFGDSTTVVYGDPIRVKQFDIGNRSEGVLQLKESVFEAIKRLTTHISTKDYDDTLLTLKSKKVNFLKPEAVNDFILKGIERNDLKSKNKPFILKRILKVLLILNLILPYCIWKLVAEPKIKEAEFVDTFRFAIAITLVPFWLVLLTITFGLTLGWSFGFAYMISVLSLAMLAIKA